MILAICGNHKLPYCTESELVWTLQSLGHTVIPFQENQTSTDDMLRICGEKEVRLWIYVHTHGWKTPGSQDLDWLIESLRGIGIKTASFHLDLHWGLQKNDQRENRIGHHPFWHTDTVFTADGGHQEAFARRGVHHEWLPPALCLRHCYRGMFRPELACDIAFVGSKTYHPEYQFRMQLIAWLERTYGSRFKRFAGDCGGVVRESRLNDLYASVKIVVGDSCFAGSPFYWSDRVPETLGRGGFLIHPATAGLEIPGLETFPAGDLGTLRQKIAQYLTQPRLRTFMTVTAMEDVLTHHTYHQRMTQMLTVMGLA